jgi:hypothetical protein
MSPEAPGAKNVRQYILQHSPQRVGVTSVGIRTLPSAAKAAAGASSRTLGLSSNASADSTSARKTKVVNPPPKSPKQNQQAMARSQSAESAEAAAWLSVVRDDENMLAGALTRVSVDLADEDGDTLLLCACRSATLGLCCAAATPPCP